MNEVNDKARAGRPETTSARPALRRATVLGHTSADGARQPSASPHLVQLIDQARTFFETDREFARRCLRDAYDLLGAEPQDSKAVTTPFRWAVRPGGLAGWQAKRALDYIEENLESTLRVGEVARSVSLSSGRFSRAFKASLGVSPGRYVARMRVERAKLMLITTSKLLSDISADCGFADQAHLNRHFRRVVSMPPGMWRRIHGSASTRAAEARSRREVIGEAARAA